MPKEASSRRRTYSRTSTVVVARGFTVYEVLARGRPGFTLAHRWSHAKRKFDEIELSAS